MLDAWKDCFSFTNDDPATGRVGLRRPQRGALYNILGHWTAIPEIPATVVMPTGTGKTETMLALLVKECLPRLLVVVPSSTLRDQIGAKFLTLGILENCRAIPYDTPYPIVGKVEHQFSTAAEAEQFLAACHVTVTTMQAVNGCSEEVRRVIAEQCSHLIIDEAHHVSAPSWNLFRQRFHGKPIVQFTATPFRNDGKHVGGKPIYAYPLRKAQEEGYFQRINFRPVFDLINPDVAIAEAAIDQLQCDLAAGFDHIVMARVDNIERSEQVLAVYRTLAPQFSPIRVHSKMTGSARREAMRTLHARETRLIVCVDMLGEGFDLPTAEDRRPARYP